MPLRNTVPGRKGGTGSHRGLPLRESLLVGAGLCAGPSPNPHANATRAILWGVVLASSRFSVPPRGMGAGQAQRPVPTQSFSLYRYPHRAGVGAGLRAGP